MADDAETVSPRLVVMVDVHVDMITVTFSESDNVGVVVTLGGVMGVVMIENDRLVNEIEGRPKVDWRVRDSSSVDVDQLNNRLVSWVEENPPAVIEELKGEMVDVE